MKNINAFHNKTIKCVHPFYRFQLSFEGLWSKHTHPKNFPNNVYLTRFGDIIGATHKVGSG